jgi:hypothetical protein
MPQIRVIAIPTDVAEAVRATAKSPFGQHPAHTEIASGHGPCRHCLSNFRVGEEERVLFTYDPFDPVDAPPLPGPVFVHQQECKRHPESGGVPAGLAGHGLTLNAYSQPRRLVVQAYCEGEELEVAAAGILDRQEVEFIHVRDTAAGCYDFRIERASVSD